MLFNSRFGIEFAPEVVRADGNVRNLAWRICNAKKVLVRVPFYLKEAGPLSRFDYILRNSWSLGI